MADCPGEHEELPGRMTCSFPSIMDLPAHKSIDTEQNTSET